MTKLILTAVIVVGGGIFWVWRRYFSLKAEKKRLLQKIRKAEYEMSKHVVGTDGYNRLRAQWMQLNREWADLARHS